MWPLIETYWKPLCIVAALVVVAAQSYDMGQASVQQKWDTERVTIAAALVKNAEAERAKEYAAQQHMNKVQTDATQRLEALRTDADSANSAANRLREQVANLLAANPVRQTSGTCTSSQTASNPGNLLAVVLDKSIQRNRELAAFADAAITAAHACEKARN